MATKVIMPQLTPEMAEGQVFRWLKQEGDNVRAGEALAEIDTDKATMELPALGSGVLRKILIQEGESALLGQVLAIIGEGGEDISALTRQAASTHARTSAASTRLALLFVDQGESLNNLAIILKDANIAPLLPHQLANTSGPVSIVIVERAAPNVISICSNLRRQDDFKDVPILVLLESAGPDQIAQLTSLDADLFFKPVVAKALSRYLTTKLPPVLVEPEDPIAPIRSRRSKKDAQAQQRKVSKLDQADGGSKTRSEPAQPVLDDVIPSSNRLLPVGAAAVLIPKGGLLCSQCSRWRVRREDAFCSRCGKALAILEMPDKVVFEPRGRHKVGQLIELKNAGQNPLRLSLGVVGENELAKRFTLHTEVTGLAGDHAEHLLATFDAEGLDLTTRYQAVLQITSNAEGYSKRTISLVVERLPIPRLVAEESYLYVLAVENQWDFRLANDGGGTLTLSTARLTGSESTPGSMVDLELLNRVVLKEGESMVVRARMPPLDVSPGKSIKKLTLEFAHGNRLEANVTFDVIRPARLAVQPPELDFGVVSTHRSGKLSLTLYNGGGEDLVVDSVKPAVDWLECSVNTPLRLSPNATHPVDVLVHGAPERTGDGVGEISIDSNSYEGAEQTIPVIVKFVEPGSYEAYVGIDFGTTASCVAVLDKDDQAFVIPLDPVPPGSGSDPRIMPSVLFFQPDGSVIAGREALNDADIQPANAVTSIKRVLGSKHKKTLAGREFDPTELTSKIIEQLMLRTENALFDLGEYKTPRRAVVTVPVEVFDNQRRALLEACKMVGLEMHSASRHGVVIDEAHAAALYYLSKKEVQAAAENGPERLLIFDFGGGTLDCALIEIEAAKEKVRLKTLAPFGDPRLGGDDIDWALVGLLADKAKQRHPDFDINCLGSEQKFNHYFRTPEIARAAYTTRARFKRQAEVAKITLAGASAVELTIEPLLRIGATPLESYIMNGAGPARFEVTLNRDELEAVVEPFLLRAASVVETICQRASVPPEEVQTILHVGRTSLLPMVRDRINELLPNATDRSELIEPKLCVALGAAFWGQIKDQPRSNFEFVGGANQLIHDVGYIDFSPSTMRQVFVTIFSAQTEFPCEKLIELPRTKEMITVQLVENRGNKSVIDGNPEIKRTGRVRIDARGVEGATIEVGFAIDENRVLQMTANGKTQNIELVDE
jgi:molecular chaperone DnaK